MVDPLNDPEPARSAPLGIGGLLVSIVLAFAVSLVGGVIGGFVHGQVPPWGLLGALVATGALIVGFRLVFESQAAAAAAAVGVLAGGMLLTLPAAGAPPVRLDGADAWLGWGWLLWPVVVESAVLLQPILRRRCTQERLTGRP